MVKLVVVAVVVAGFVGWRWQRREPHANDAATHEILQNRFWVDHLPQGEKDTVRVFALWEPESFGVFADQNRWRVQLERFRYEVKGDQVNAVFPLSGDRETIKLEAYRCDEAEMDFCLDVAGSNHCVKRYYSRHGWVRRDRQDIDQFVNSLR